MKKDESAEDFGSEVKQAWKKGESGKHIGYLGFAFYFAFTTDSDLNVLLLATILVPLSFFYNSFNSIAIARRPQAISYGLIVFETVKIPLGFVLLVIFDLEIFGVILTVILADVARLIFVSIMSTGTLGETFLSSLK